MDSYLLDLRYTLRCLRNSPGFTLAALLTLALGIGACTTIFNVVNTLLLRAQPGIEDADEVVAVHTREGDDAPGISSYADFADLRRDSGVFASLAAFKRRPMDLGLEGSSERLSGLMVTSGYFETLGVGLVLGRSFTEAEDGAVGAAQVAVLGHGLWSRSFGARRDVVGETIRLNGGEFTVVGVAPAGFRGTMIDAAPDVFVPMSMQPYFMPSAGNLLEKRGWCGLWIVGRRLPGTSWPQVHGAVEQVAARLQQEYPQTNEGRTFLVRPLAEAALPPAQRSGMVKLSSLLLAGVALFLLIACVNVANLLLARSARRVREMAVRSALGAERGRLVRQLLLESAVLSLAGGAGGVLLTVWSREAFRTLPLPDLDLTFDWRVLSFALALSLATCLVFGLVPAWRGSGVDLKAAHNFSQAASPHRRHRAAGAFVVLQVAVSVVLLVAAGLFVRTFHNLLTTDVGMEVEDVLVAKLDPAIQRYEGERLAAFYDRALERITALPAVRLASVTSSRPGGGEGDSLGLWVDGSESQEERPDARFGISMVGLDFFDTVGIPRLDGRGFSQQDRAGTPPVVVVNETGARLLVALTGRPAVGTQVSVAGRQGPWSEVVGVVADSKTGSLRADPEPFAYGSYTQLTAAGFDWPMSLVVRTEVAPMTVLPAVRAAIHDIDPYLPLLATSTLERYMFGEALVIERMTTWTLGVVAALALFLAAIGLYGVVSYSVSSRRRELGIRRALGAPDSELQAMVIRNGMKLVVVGLLFGGAGALAAGRAMSALLYRLSGSDPLTLALVVVQLLAVALIACWLPARRALRVDPVETLRVE